MTAHDDGEFYPRYTVTHKDNKPIDPTKQYLVIEVGPMPDARELAAICGFIEMCRLSGYPELAESLQAAVNDQDDPGWWYVVVNWEETEYEYGPMTHDHAIRMTQDIQQFGGADVHIRGHVA